MIKERAINEFRAGHGIEAVYHFDGRESDHCFSHCVAMARRGEIYHAEPHYLQGWSEAVAMLSNDGSYEDTLRKAVWNVLGASDQHRDILLRCPVLAIGVYIADNNMYITIRGK